MVCRTIYQSVNQASFEDVHIAVREKVTGEIAGHHTDVYDIQQNRLQSPEHCDAIAMTGDF